MKRVSRAGLRLALLIAVPLAVLPQTIESPQIRRVVGLNYPRVARKIGIQGEVRLIARVLEDGSVAEVRVTEDKVFLTEPAKESLSRWVFAGCTGSQKHCEVEVTFTFKLTNEICKTQECPSEFRIDVPGSVTIEAKRFPAGIN